MSSRVFLIYGSRTLDRLGIIKEIVANLNEQGLVVEPFQVASHEPEVADVNSLVANLLRLRPSVADVVIAIGGGSTIDLAKAAAALATNRQAASVADYLEGVGKGLQIVERPLNLIAVPTTAGTGSEVTKNAVISSYDPPFKKSLRSDGMIPGTVLVDPELSVTVPSRITAATGMDAITQLIESFISCRAAPIPRALALSGLKLAIPALPIAVRNGTDRASREAMSQAALLSGLSLANSGLGMAHGVAAAMGVHCRISHGMACAVMLPATLRANRIVRQAEYASIERLFGNSPENDSVLADRFVLRIESLCAEIGIPKRLRDLKIEAESLTKLVAGSRGNSMSGNPCELSDAELLSILQSIW